MNTALKLVGESSRFDEVLTPSRNLPFSTAEPSVIVADELFPQSGPANPRMLLLAPVPNTSSVIEPSTSNTIGFQPSPQRPMKFDQHDADGQLASTSTGRVPVLAKLMVAVGTFVQTVKLLV